MPLKRFCFIPVIAALVAGAGGCGGNTPRTAPVKGIVQWEDGKPVSGASVRFAPVSEGGHNAVGFTSKSGEFELT